MRHHLAVFSAVAVFGGPAVFAYAAPLDAATSTAPAASSTVVLATSTGAEVDPISAWFTDDMFDNASTTLNDVIKLHELLLGEEPDFGTLLLWDWFFRPKNASAHATSVFSGTLFEGFNHDLATLFLLDRLFEGHNNGILDDGGTTLGDIFILNQLF